MEIKSFGTKLLLGVSALAGSAMAYTATYPLSDSPNIFADVLNNVVLAVVPYAPALVGLFVLGFLIDFVLKLWHKGKGIF